MSKKEAPLGALEDFLPKGSYLMVEPFLLQYNVHLTITRSRKTILGDYRNAITGKAHRITVNGNLNRFSFLITLLHELAHLITFMRFGNAVAAHGNEWKNQFSDILKQFIQAELFPLDVKRQLIHSIKNPAASSCADTDLMRVLRQYDYIPEGVCLVEELADGSMFKIGANRVFKVQKRLRKRIQALEVSTGKTYLFSPVYEVFRYTN
jgi:SprT protein